MNSKLEEVSELMSEYMTEREQNSLIKKPASIFSAQLCSLGASALNLKCFVFKFLSGLVF